MALADSILYAGLFSDQETKDGLSDRSEIDSMVAVEVALARVQGRLGLIPAAAARHIGETLANTQIAPASLSEGTTSSGVAVSPLVSALRDVVGAEHGRYVHWGATSQDIVDTALMLRLRPLMALWDTRLELLCRRLGELAREHRSTVMAARTRSQQATPTTFGLKVAGWQAPLVRARARLDVLAPRLLVVQLGGASGNLAAMGDRGLEVMEALAEELSLNTPPAPWHTQRDTLVELGGCLALVTGSLGKMGLDLVRLGQSEVGEVQPGAGGGSSTMPQKSNPIAAEALVSLARFNATLSSAMHETSLQEHERDGMAWNIEWMTLRQMAVAASTALGHALSIAHAMKVNPARMMENLARSNGLVLAEAATFALAEHMPRPQAQTLVKAACTTALDTGQHLVDVLQARTSAAVDWVSLRDPDNYVGLAPQMADRILHECDRLSATIGAGAG